MTVINGFQYAVSVFVGWWATAVLLFGISCSDGAVNHAREVNGSTENSSLADRVEKGNRMNLQKEFEKMRERRGDTYRPRTRHLDEKGKAKYTNRLFLESSPYLLQHAHNPVDWYPWGDEAFDTARQLDRPVLLSVGYSTCHWCHVMEEESFEDEEIARFINDNYIAVKVDREERPDVDAIYMSAVQAITGRGGWPMTVWLTPDREPFYGGTYFPARDGDRGSPVGFLTLLKKIRGGYDDKRELVTRSAEELAQAIQRMLAPASGDRLPMDGVLERAVSAGKTQFDPVNGGIKGAPKFPSSFPIRLMIRHHRRTGDGDSLRMAELTLERMADSGMVDQIGGGFHRYSTDDHWLVPHFEKMLYDNALLVIAYIEGWQVTKASRFQQVFRETLDYVAREMTSPEGAFFSATDADSLTPSGHQEEGWFFTWTLAELQSTLGDDDARIAATAYGVTVNGNFEGRNVLYRPRKLDAIATELDMSIDDLASALKRINSVLYATRHHRPPPLRDEKIIAAWNGLMISAFARAGFVLDDPAYVAIARKAAEFILEKMVVDGRIMRSYKDGTAGNPGFLNDHAFFIAALLDLFEVTGDQRILSRAVELDRALADRFEDRENGGFYMTSTDHESLIAREKPALDSALPSGNAVALMNLLRLGHITLDPTYLKRAEEGFKAFSTIIEANPSAFGEMLLALNDFLYPPYQVIIVTQNEDDASVFTDWLQRVFMPGSLVMAVTPLQAEKLSLSAPIFKDKIMASGKATVYVCRNGACQLPVTTIESLKRQLNG